MWYNYSTKADYLTFTHTGFCFVSEEGDHSQAIALYLISNYGI